MYTYEKYRWEVGGCNVKYKLSLGSEIFHEYEEFFKMSQNMVWSLLIITYRGWLKVTLISFVQQLEIPKNYL